MTITKYSRWVRAITLFAALTLFGGCGADPGNIEENELPIVNQPNVVLIFLDDGAYDDFEPFGRQPIRTTRCSPCIGHMTVPIRLPP